MNITLENYKQIDTNPHVLFLVLFCLERGDTLAISETNEVLPYSEYVCTCNMGVVQRMVQ